MTFEMDIETYDPGLSVFWCMAQDTSNMHEPLNIEKIKGRTPSLGTSTIYFY